MTEQQLTLDGLAPLVAGHGATIQERFESFHERNPWVYTALVSLARQELRRGRPRVGIGMLTEVLRWHARQATDDPSSDYRINNDYRSRYARLIADQEPDLAEAFETRELRAA